MKLRGTIGAATTLSGALLGGCSSGAAPQGSVPSIDSGSGGDSSQIDSSGGGIPDAAPADDHSGTELDSGTTAPAQDASAVDATSPVPPGDAFVLRAEWNGPCAASGGAVDVNLGNSPETFVRAAYCQVNGAEPPAATITMWANQLRTVEYVRRIDVVRTFCHEANRNCTLAYSDPWTNDPVRTAPCARKTSRDVGAVMMFFFNCPKTPNCAMDWANTHAWGMSHADPIYGAGAGASGYYIPTNAGFWLRELLDARYAGLQFMLPNVYGPDVQPGTGEVANLESALTTIDGMGGGIRVALFNDTWAWGRAGSGTLMNPAPSLADTETAAQRIYGVEWKPFFGGISPPHWYTVNGQPLIYFYNAGTLAPATGLSAVLARMKQLFQADFGITPFVVVDRGFGATASGDGTFVWDTFQNDPASHTATATGVTGGLTFDNSMVKWDSLGRDMPGAIATANTRMHKGTQILGQVLQESASANLLLLETWNDLGEGTGITRNYDYYDQGAWLTPDAFMNTIRATQCSN
jgi:hypothetical protein